MLLHEFSQPENLPYAVALGSMFVLGLVQVIGLFAGAGTFSFLDDLLPDLDADIDLNLEVEADVEASMPEPGGFTAVLSWLNLGRVPLLISLIAFLFLYAFAGFNLQGVVVGLTGFRVPAVIGGIGVFLLVLPFMRWINAGLARMLPKDETMAVSRKTFIGRVATITLGTSSVARAAEARVTGPLGRTHYIMVVPDNEGETFPQGAPVLIVGQRGSNFTVIAVDNPNLQSQD